MWVPGAGWHHLWTLMFDDLILVVVKTSTWAYLIAGVGWLVTSCNLRRSKCYVVVPYVPFNSFHIFFCACRSRVYMPYMCVCVCVSVCVQCTYVFLQAVLYYYMQVPTSWETKYAGCTWLRIWFGCLDKGVGKVWLAMPRRDAIAVWSQGFWINLRSLGNTAP